MREFTFVAVILGVIICVLFGAANAYIGLKVGMTVSASIPAAVISMTVLRIILRRDSVLENNIVQTIASAGVGLASGMIFTIPALYIFAAKDNAPEMIPSYWEIVTWGIIGGLLGVFFMVPMRRMLIVKEHGKLPFPEGVACAEVLKSGERGGSGAGAVFWGFGLAGAYELIRQLGFWPDAARQRLPVLRTDAALSADPALLGVGYILGARIAAYMLGGAVLGWFVIIPAISYFGQGATEVIAPAESGLISDMAPIQIWANYLRYIGAGAVITGGLLSLFRSLRTVLGSLAHLAGRGEAVTDRTQRDIPVVLLLLGIVGLGAAMWYLPQYGLMNAVLQNIPVIACFIGFGFFFVTVSSRLVGIVGSSSNPASGMTIAAILGTAIVILSIPNLGLTPAQTKFAILSVGALVCLAICIAGDTSQDLKTGFLVGATPWKQQIGLIVGVVAASLVIAWTLQMINNTAGFVPTESQPRPFQAPQANIMKLLIEGLVDQKLPWGLVISGVAAGLVVEMLGIASLPFAVGLYLPLELSSPIMVGGLIRWFVDWRRGQAREGEDAGVLGASGMVAGQGIAGVLLIGATAFIGWAWNNPLYKPTDASVAQDVRPGHLFDWLTTKLGFLEPNYGLKSFDAGAHFVGSYAIDPYHLLPLLPFALLALWLMITAFRRLPPAVNLSAEGGAAESPSKADG